MAVKIDSGGAVWQGFKEIKGIPKSPKVCPDKKRFKKGAGIVKDRGKEIATLSPPLTRRKSQAIE